MSSSDFDEVVTRRYGLVPYQPELSVMSPDHPIGVIKRKRTSTKDRYATELDDGHYIAFIHCGRHMTPKNVAASLTIDLADGVPLNTYVGIPDWCSLMTIELDEGAKRNAQLAKGFADGFVLEDLAIMNGTAKGIFNPVQLGPRLFMTNTLQSMNDRAEWAAFCAKQAVSLESLTAASATKFLKSLIMDNWLCMPSIAMAAYTGYEYECDALPRLWEQLFPGIKISPLLCDFDFMYAFVEKNASMYPEYSVKMI